MKYRLPAVLVGSLAAVSGLLAGCSARTEVSLSGNTPAAVLAHLHHGAGGVVQHQCERRTG